MVSGGRSHSDRSCHTLPPPHAGLPYWERTLPHPGRASGQQPNLPLQALKPEPEVRVLVQLLEVRVVGKGVMAVCAHSSTEGRQWHCARAAYAGCRQQQAVAAAGQRWRQQRQLMQLCIWWAIEGGCRLRALGYAGWRLKRRGVSLLAGCGPRPFAVPLLGHLPAPMGVVMNRVPMARCSPRGTCISAAEPLRETAAERLAVRYCQLPDSGRRGVARQPRSAFVL